MTSFFRFIAVAFIPLAALGCSTVVTKVEFRGPPGAVLTLNDQRYALPAVISLVRPKDVDKINRSDLTILFPNFHSQAVDAEGVIEVFPYSESDVDRLSTNTCDLAESEIAKLLDGYAVVFEGTSASKQKIYRLTIGRKK